MCYKENKSLFFRRHEKWPIFSCRCFHFQYDNRFFFNREMGGTLGRAKRCACRNLLNLDCQDSIRFSIFQVS